MGIPLFFVSGLLFKKIYLAHFFLILRAYHSFISLPSLHLLPLLGGLGTASYTQGKLGS